MMTDTRTDGRVGAGLRRLLLIFSPLWLVACGNDAAAPLQQFVPSGEVPVQRTRDPALLNTGAQLFRDNCARCHGAEAQGVPDWRKAGPDGKFPPPPLNGTGHAWHHPTEVLLEVIMDGSVGVGNMPAWRGKLTDDEARAIIAWFQSLWSDDVYAIWADLDLRYREETR